MRTAVLVLAILGDVFGGIGTVLAFVFGAAVIEMSGGFAGRGAANGAVLALLALVIGIIGTALATRRPKIAGGLLVIAAILGTVGTNAFVLGSLLYLIGGAMAFFVKPLALSATTPVAASTTGSVGVFATAEEPTVVLHRFRPLAARRMPLVVGAIAVVILALVAGSALAQPAEQKPVNALLSGLQRGDDVALANLLLPGLRANDAVADADAVLSNAFGRSQISFVSADWLRKWGPITGTKIAFENLTVTTASKGANAAVVHVRAIFAPTNDNPLINVIVQVLRQAFDADLPMASESGQWYVAGAPAKPPDVGTGGGGGGGSGGGSTGSSGGGPSTPPPPPPTTPPPPLPTVTMAGATFTADFNTARDLMTAGRVGFGRFQLTYGAGRALLSECAGGVSDNRCLWGLDHTGWLAVAATAHRTTTGACSCVLTPPTGVIVRDSGVPLSRRSIHHAVST